MSHIPALVLVRYTDSDILVIVRLHMVHIYMHM